jgi:hypothetical protein
MRKTERRLPAPLLADDLGQSVDAPDARCTLVSFATAPIVVARDNAYVVFVPDDGLAGSADSFEWTFTENGNVARVVTTEHSVVRHAPSAVGALTVAVRILDGANSEQAALALDQTVVLPSAELEALISSAQESPGPGAGSPVVLREMVNEHARYYQQVAPRTPEGGDAFSQFLFGMAVDGAGRRTAAERWEHAEQLASALDQQPDDVARLAAIGVGVCSVRLALLAMLLPGGAGGAPVLAFTELPQEGPPHAVADEALRQQFLALSEEVRIDLFNVVRFPKSNIAACGRMLEALRDRYFAGTSFNDVLTGMSGTRAQWIIRSYTEGPLQKS